MLRCYGAQVVAFASGEDFLTEAPRDEGSDCVILDLHLPGLTGFQVEGRLCRFRTRTCP